MTQFNSPYYFLHYPGTAAAVVSDRKMYQHQVHHHQPMHRTTILPSYARYFKEHNEQQIVTKRDPGTTIENLYPEILTIIFAKLNVRDKGRVAQVCSSWRDAVYAKRCWKGVEAKLHLRRMSCSVLFSSLIKRGIRRVHVLSLKRNLKDVINSLPNLEVLNLSGTYNINDSVLINAFAKQRECPNIRVLDLSFCKQVTDEGLKKIILHLVNLEELKLEGCGNITNAGLMLIGWGLTRLKRLSLRSCQQVSDQGIASLVRHPEGNQTLEYLSLEICPRISDEGLLLIAEGVPLLTSLNLSFCSSITDQGLKHLSRMSHLEDLNLSSCENISDMGLAFLRDSSTSLRDLNLSFCVKIGDNGLGYIAQSMYHLRSLNLSACHITDEGLIKVARASHELIDLKIGQCVAITDKSVHVVAEELKNLRAIDVYGCTKITSVGLEVIVKLPKLDQLNLGIWNRSR